MVISASLTGDAQLVNPVNSTRSDQQPELQDPQKVILSACFSVCLVVCLSVSLFLWLFVCFSGCLSVSGLLLTAADHPHQHQLVGKWSGRVHGD